VDDIPPFIVDEEFPFHKFFDNAPQPLFKGDTFEENLAIAESCYRYLEWNISSLWMTLALFPITCSPVVDSSKRLFIVDSLAGT
jgi:hypothetical protein